MNRRTRLFLDVGANVLAPFVVLTFFAGPEWLGPRWAPAIAATVPLAHLIWRWVTTRRTSPLSWLALLSIGINGALGFVPVDPFWFAVKEGAVPIAIGAWIAVDGLRGPGLVAAMIEELIDAARMREALQSRGTSLEGPFRRTNFGFAAVSAATGVLSAGLAAFLVQDPSGTTAFSEQLGRYTAWSWGVATFPTMLLAAWLLRRLLRDVEVATGLGIEELAR